MILTKRFAAAALFVLACGFAQQAAATPVPLPKSVFAGDALIDFGAVPFGTVVNGLVTGGVTFGFTVGGSGSTDATVTNTGPGVSNNINPLNIEGNATGVLSLTFPQPELRFGLGFALISPGSLTIALFDAASTPLGSLTYPGVPDPTFPGGFAGIGNDVAFTRALVTFAPGPVRFAADNIRFSTAATVPEPGTLVLLGTGLAVVGRRIRSRRKRDIE